MCHSNLAVYIQPKIAIDLILYSSMSVNVMSTVVVFDNYYPITETHITQLMTVNWLQIFAVCSLTAGSVQFPVTKKESIT